MCSFVVLTRKTRTTTENLYSIISLVKVHRRTVFSMRPSVGDLSALAKIEPVANETTSDEDSRLSHSNPQEDDSFLKPRLSQGGKTGTTRDGTTAVGAGTGRTGPYGGGADSTDRRSSASSDSARRSSSSAGEGVLHLGATTEERRTKDGDRDDAVPAATANDNEEDPASTADQPKKHDEQLIALTRAARQMHKDLKNIDEHFALLSTQQKGLDAVLGEKEAGLRELTALNDARAEELALLRREFGTEQEQQIVDTEPDVEDWVKAVRVEGVGIDSEIGQATEEQRRLSAQEAVQRDESAMLVRNQEYIRTLKKQVGNDVEAFRENLHTIIEMAGAVDLILKERRLLLDAFYEGSREDPTAEKAKAGRKSMYSGGRPSVAAGALGRGTVMAAVGADGKVAKKKKKGSAEDAFSWFETAGAGFLEKIAEELDHKQSEDREHQTSAEASAFVQEPKFSAAMAEYSFLHQALNTTVNRMEDLRHTFLLDQTCLLDLVEEFPREEDIEKARALEKSGTEIAPEDHPEDGWRVEEDRDDDEFFDFSLGVCVEDAG